jgi:phosphoribosylaminoimidazolecarboxamide formyltransferase / IMP cyclohydrolase
MAMKQALISVSDKTGIVDFAKALAAQNYSLLSTGGTAKLLREAGLAVTEVADYTGYPEMLDGRIKTLHPKVHGGLLGRRDLKNHVAQMQSAGIEPIDLVCVNLYPFQQTIAKENCTLEDAIENIDIGGPAMLRSSAKNWEHVTVVIDPADYATVLAEIAQGGTTRETRFRLSTKVFAHTSAYDGAIAQYLSSLASLDKVPSRNPYPATLSIQLAKVQDMRYGENPHQSAAFYRDAPSGNAHEKGVSTPSGLLAHWQQLQGKELSFNNIADADAAWECVKTFDAPACVIVKHANPCGVAVADNVLAAYGNAFKTDPTSAFGGIIAFNRTVDAACAEAVAKQFVEVVLAPAYDSAALAVFAAKQNVRVLAVLMGNGHNTHDIKRVGGGFLVQSPDIKNIASDELKVVTARAPTDAEMRDLLFAWRVAKYVKSNAIVFCGNGMTLGVGAGQMSRVDSTRIAAIKATNAGLSLAGSVVASDAFFPFRDGVDVLAQAGAKAVIQPGGSMRDDEVISAANEHGLAMVLTGTRHFRH